MPDYYNVVGSVYAMLGAYREKLRRDVSLHLYKNRMDMIK